MYYLNQGGRELVLLTSLIVPVGCWLLSLSRTPYAILWLVWSTMVSILMVVGAFSFVHVTMAGAYAAVALGLGALTWIPAIATELTAAEETCGAIAGFRRDHPIRFPRIPGLPQAAGPKWEVQTAHDNSSYSANQVKVWIARNGKKREIGIGDPVADQEEFADLKVRAQDAADTYNHEGIV